MACPTILNMTEMEFLELCTVKFNIDEHPRGILTDVPVPRPTTLGHVLQLMEAIGGLRTDVERTQRNLSRAERRLTYYHLRIADPTYSPTLQERHIANEVSALRNHLTVKEALCQDLEDIFRHYLCAPCPGNLDDPRLDLEPLAVMLMALRTEVHSEEAEEHLLYGLPEYQAPPHLRGDVIDLD